MSVCKEYVILPLLNIHSFFKHCSSDNDKQSTIIHLNKTRQCNIGCFTLDKKLCMIYNYLECSIRSPIFVPEAKNIVGGANSNGHNF